MTHRLTKTKSSLTLAILVGFSYCLTTSLGQAADPTVSKLGLVTEKPASGRYVKTDLGYMIPYVTTIPGTNVKYHMEPIPGGQGPIGSPAGEAKREAVEGPQFQTVQQPYWLGKYELRWAEYKEYMALHDIFKSFETHKIRPLTEKHQADAITAPSNLYDTSFTFVNGENPKLPAVTIRFSTIYRRIHQLYLNLLVFEIFLDCHMTN